MTQQKSERDRQSHLTRSPAQARGAAWIFRPIGGADRRKVSSLLRRGIVACGVATMSCAGAASLDPPRNTISDATEMERTRCAPDVQESGLAPVLSGEAVESVLPLYTHSESQKFGEVSRLYGAVIRVRAIQGLTAEWLDRALECHSARRVLGRIPETDVPNDPFWLPGRTVDIDAESARDGFQVAIRGTSVDDAQEILIRANAFVASKQKVSH